MFVTEYEDEIYKNLSAINEHVKVWKKSEIPPEYHYTNNKRIPPVLMAADEGWGIKENWDNPNYLCMCSVYSSRGLTKLRLGI